MNNLLSLNNLKGISKQGGNIFNPNQIDSLQAFYKTKSDTHFLDSKGDYHGTQYEKSVYNFNGVNGYGVTTDLGADELITEMEFYAYMSTDTTSTTGIKQVFGTYNAVTSYTGLSFGDATGSLTGEVFAILNDGVAREGITNNIPLGWHKYRIVWTGAKHDIYIDGVLGTYIKTGTPVQLNARQIWFATRSSLSQWWAGQLSNIKITTATKTYEYFCEERTGTVALDSSGNDNHGTLIGGVTHTTARSPLLVNHTNEEGYTIADGVTHYRNNNGTGLLVAGTIIPRDESNPTKCTAYTVGGTQIDLQFVGKVAPDLKMAQSNCVNFDGVNGYGFYNKGLNILTGSAYTAFARIKTGVIVGGRRCIMESKTSYEIAVDINSAGNKKFVAYCQIAGGGDVRVYSNYVAQDNTTYSVAVRYGDGFLSLFVNGVIVGQTASTAELYDFAKGLYVGTYRGANDRFFVGDIYDVKVFSTPLIDSKILKLHKQEAITETPVVSFNLAEGSGTTCYAREDETKTLTLVGGATHAKQDIYHANVMKGFTRGFKIVSGGSHSLPNMVNGNVLKFKLKSTDSQAVFITSSVANKYTLVVDNGSSATAFGDAANMAVSSIKIDGVTYNQAGLNRTLAYTLLCDGSFHDVEITFNSNINSWTSIKFGGYVAPFDTQNTSMIGVSIDDVLIVGQQKLPFKINGAYSNPSTDIHNGSETKGKMEVLRKEIATVETLYNQTTFVSNTVDVASLPLNTNDKVFVKRKGVDTKQILVCNPALVGGDLTKMNKYVGN